MCVAHTRRTTTTYNYLKSRLSAIDTAGFFKGEWKENYYVCGAYKKNDNNVQLPQISAVVLLLVCATHIVVLFPLTFEETSRIYS